jgi:hypothetical protein
MDDLLEVGNPLFTSQWRLLDKVSRLVFFEESIEVVKDLFFGNALGKGPEIHRSD